MEYSSNEIEALTNSSSIPVALGELMLDRRIPGESEYGANTGQAVPPADHEHDAMSDTTDARTGILMVHTGHFEDGHRE